MTTGPGPRWRPTLGWRLRETGPLLPALTFLVLLVLGWPLIRWLDTLGLSRGATSGVLVVAGSAVGTFAVTWVRGIVGRRRPNPYAALAAGQGWTLQPLDPGLPARWTRPPFDPPAADKTAQDVVTGTRGGVPFTAFRYGFRRAIGDRASYHELQVLAVRLPAALPPLQLEPRTAVNSLVRAVASSPPPVEGIEPELAGRYAVRSEDPAYARALLSPAVADALLRAEPTVLVVEGADLLAVRRRPARPQEALAALDALVAAVAALPPDVVRTFGRIR